MFQFLRNQEHTDWLSNFLVKEEATVNTKYSFSINTDDIIVQLESATPNNVTQISQETGTHVTSASFENVQLQMCRESRRKVVLWGCVL